MKFIKEMCLSDLPDLTEKIVSRIIPVGKNGHCTMKNYMQIFNGEKLISEAGSIEGAYKKAYKKLKNEH